MFLRRLLNTWTAARNTPAPDPARLALMKHNCSAPISALPSEIVSCIFEEGAAGDPRFSLTVGSVTSMWRAIALGTPRIWTEIQVAHTDSSLRLLELFLERSMTVDIYLTANMAGTPVMDSCRPLDAFMTAMQPHIHRCSSVTAYFFCTEDVAHFLCVLGLAVQHKLRSLCLGGQTQSAHGRPWRISSSQFPSMQTLKLVGTLRSVVFDCSLGSITHLDIGDVSPIYDPSLRTLLATAPLVRLRISIEVLEQHDIFPPPVNLPTLRYLHISQGDYSRALEELLSHITAPLVDSLTVDIIGIDEWMELIDTLSNVDLSLYPCLTRLTLCNTPLDFASNNGWGQVFDAVKHLAESLPPILHIKVTRTNSVQALDLILCPYPAEADGRPSGVRFAGLKVVSFRDSSKQFQDAVLMCLRPPRSTVAVEFITDEPGEAPRRAEAQPQ